MITAETAGRKKVNLAHYNNDWYRPGAPGWKKAAWYFVNIIFFVNPLFPISGIKCLILRLFGATVGKGVVIKPSVNIKYPWLLKIGDHVWIGEHVWIDNLVQVEIGNNVTLSQGAMLLTGSHNYKKEHFDLMVKEIVLEEGVWIGAKAVVCPGVTCFSHSILSVGSVATTNLAAYFIYQGVPAEQKRERIIN